MHGSCFFECCIKAEGKAMVPLIGLVFPAPALAKGGPSSRRLPHMTQRGIGVGKNLTDKQTDQTRHFKEKKKCKNGAIQPYSPSML